MSDDPWLDDEDDEDIARRDRYLIFELNDQEPGSSHAIALDQVREIVGLQPVTPLPSLPPYLRGVMNLRGTIIPIIELRLRFNLPERNSDSRTCILVVEHQGERIGLQVDDVHAVTRIPADNMQAPSAISRHPCSRFIAAMGRDDNDKVHMLIDLDQLLNQDPVASEQIDGA